MDKIDNAVDAYKKCASQIETQTWFIDECKLPKNFHSWFASAVLHIWIYSTRLKLEGDEGKAMSQEIFNHLWVDVELELHKAGAQRILNIVKDLLSGYYGHTLAYNEGLFKGDPVLASALWKNVYGGKEINATQLAVLLRYVREQLKRIHDAPKDEILSGKFKFERMTEKIQY
ncbi:hypothetical protein HK096_000662 [Nowakowskiella sp. JEL0078]|nr:hypothetical protein HK096_000662 [Nowakowskiella sp. JEL0078]